MLKKKIDIKMPLPGPKAKEWVKKDSRFVSSSYTRSYPLVAEKSKGMYIEDIDGNTFLDFSAGIATCATGHCHPDVTKAIKNQSGKLIHLSGTDFYYLPQIKLAEKLAEITPGGKNKKTFFCNSGAEAVECCIKLARYTTKKTQIVAFNGSFHGRTLGALSLTSSKAVQRRHFQPLLPGVTHMQFAYCYRCPYNLTYPKCDVYCANWLDEQLFKGVLPPEDVAAIIIEPIQGEGGYVVPPKKFHKRLFQIAKKYNILYIVDEVQTGMGRTGKMMAIEHFGVIPDAIALAKGIASGMPLGACVAKSTVMDWEPGAHASTFGGNPISCEASLATIDLLEQKLIKNTNQIGEFFQKRLLDLKNKYELIGDVRGKGLMIGVELVKDRETKERAIKERNNLVQTCFEKGLLLLGCGQNGIRFVPPLIINRGQADTALSIFEEALRTRSK